MVLHSVDHDEAISTRVHVLFVFIARVLEVGDIYSLYSFVARALKQGVRITSFPNSKRVGVHRTSFRALQLRVVMKCRRCCCTDVPPRVCIHVCAAVYARTPVSVSLLVQ